MTPPTWLYWPLILPSGTVSATGGTVTDVDGYRYHIFTSDGTFAVTAGGEVEVLLVAGGGSGATANGPHQGGGGGAGGVRLLDGGNALTVASSINYTVTVGTGGAARTSSLQGGANGAASSFVGGSVSESTTGGGGGGYFSAAAQSGGSGGGGGTNSGTTNLAGGAGTSGQGNAGGSGRSSNTTSDRGGGGGGGKNSAGANGASNTGGNGGDGLSVWGTLGGNAPGAYGGGGGGGCPSGGTPGSGGSGGGGSGGYSGGTSGTTNTGGGGGGTGTGSSGAGGSGIVIVRYPLSAAVLWMPTDLTGLQCWLDASDSSTITESGGSISLWEDKTANNYDADDAVNSSNVKITTKRPTVATAAQNSLDAINFNGSQWFDHNTARGMLKDRSCALMAVAMKYGSLNNAYQFAWTNRSTTGSTSITRFQLIHENSNQFAVFSMRLDADTSFETVNTNANPPYNTNWHIHVAVLDWAADTLSYYIDGSLIGTDSYPSGGANTSNTDLPTIHTTWTAIGNTGRSGAINLPLSSGSRIGEMICGAISSGSYATSDREKLEGYLAWKWGLDANLPNGHPYENAAP